MKVDVICFDFGDTLLADPFERVMMLQSVAFQKIFEEHGYGIERENIIYAWRSANNKVHYKFISHFFQEKEIVLNMLERLGIKGDIFSLTSELLAIYRSGLMATIKNDKGLEKTRRVLERLRQKGKRLSILSSERVNSLEAMLRWSGLKGYMEKVIVTEAIGIDKPDPRVFWFVLRAMSIKKEDMIYVGNSYFYDIEPAKKYGIKTVWLLKDKKKKQTKIKYKPDVVIRDIDDLLDIME